MAAISKGNGIRQGLFGYSLEMAEETYESGSQCFSRLLSFSLVPLAQYSFKQTKHSLVFVSEEGD